MLGQVRYCAALLASLLLAACGGSSSAGPPPSGGNPVVAPPPSPTPTPTASPAPLGSVERDIAPTTTNPAIMQALAAHFTVSPTADRPPAGRLFVMLPGTGAIPRFYREVARTGAMRGYHAVGLTHPNDIAVGDRCAGSGDIDCPSRVRREVITGENASTLIEVPRAESITGRLVALLDYLDRTYPGEGWGQYLVGVEPDWSRIVVAGHSQGGGHAAYLAKLHSLVRMVMFSSPGDMGLTVGSPAAWYALPNATPLSRQYGFTHTEDELVPLNFIVSNWRAIGIDLFGGPVSVDGNAAPYGGSHQLTTALPPNPNPPGPVIGPRHASPVVDAATPRDAAGNPLYRPVWIALAFP